MKRGFTKVSNEVTACRPSCWQEITVTDIRIVKIVVEGGKKRKYTIT